VVWLRRYYSQIRKQTHTATEDAQDVWQAIMGMDTDSGSEEDQNINVAQNSAVTVEGDDADSEKDSKAESSHRRLSTRNSINLKGSDIDTSDEDSK
jgi:hypothetical protein